MGEWMADKRTQLENFKQAARDLECDDDEARFKERLGKLVKGERRGRGNDA